jgi:FdhD protein
MMRDLACNSVSQAAMTATADTEDEMEARLWIRGREFCRVMRARSRSPVGWVGCGVEAVSDVIWPVRSAREGHALSLGAVRHALDGLAARQTLYTHIHMVCVAAWATPGGDITLLREGASRHNALDKLTGAALWRGIDFDDGFCVIARYCGNEAAQEVSAFARPLRLEDPAPIGLALRKADDAGVALVALARPDAQTVGTHPSRGETGVSDRCAFPFPLEA